MWSLNSRLGKGLVDDFYGEEKEDLLRYARTVLVNEKIDYFVFGHRHLPLKVSVGENSEYINLGDWIGYFTYGVFDGQTFELKKFDF